MEGLLICPQCKEEYNHIDHIPKVLPCGHTCCLQCIQPIGSPQHFKPSCPIDKKAIRQSVDQLATNISLLDIVSAKSPSLGCSLHPKKEIEFYCPQHKQVLCISCSFQHGDHSETLKEVNQQSVVEFVNQSQPLLEKIEVEIQAQRQKLGLLLKPTTKTTSSELIEIVMKTRQILEGNNMFQEINPDIKSYLFDIGQEVEEQEEEITGEVQLMNLGGTYQTIKQLKIESKIVQTTDDIGILTTWLQADVVLSLIYRGSRDGFTQDNFHQRCDNQGSTLVLIKSKQGNIFGGFTSISWVNSQSWNSRADPKAFIFSITHKTKHEQYQQKSCAVQNMDGYLFLFGSDICLRPHCDTGPLSHSCLGHTYLLPQGMKNNSEESKNYLAGSQYFQVDELEVFKVNNFKQ